ncbi:hypothetical protein GEMRC1_003233 [Eukaryota sp. GEM-RC1]
MNTINLESFVNDIQLRSNAFLNKVSLYQMEQDNIPLNDSSFSKSISRRKTHSTTNRKSTSTSYLNTYLSKTDTESVTNPYHPPSEPSSLSTTHSVRFKKQTPRRRKFLPNCSSSLDTSVMSSNDLDSLIFTDRQAVFNLTQCLSPQLHTSMRSSQKKLRSELNESSGYVIALCDSLPKRSK